jgi:hypothetical protein
VTPEEKDAFLRRRRGRNIALFVALLGLVALFYVISIAKMTGG